MKKEWESFKMLLLILLLLSIFDYYVVFKIRKTPLNIKKWEIYGFLMTSFIIRLFLVQFTLYYFDLLDKNSSFIFDYLLNG